MGGESQAPAGEKFGGAAWGAFWGDYIGGGKAVDRARGREERTIAPDAGSAERRFAGRRGAIVREGHILNPGEDPWIE